LRASLSVLSLLVVMNACRDEQLPSEGHLRIHLDTDAPLPRAGRRASPLEPMPIVDTVHIDLLTATGEPACSTCTREFALDEDDIDTGATFSVLTSEARATVLHTVAFRAAASRSALPGARIEVWARLPAPPPEGPRPMTLRLPMDAFGRPLGSLAAPVDLLEVAPVRPRALWPRAERRPCEGTAPPDTVCIPGGAFWMGAPDDPAFAALLSPRVVTLSPFLTTEMDRDERLMSCMEESANACVADGDCSGGLRCDLACPEPQPGESDDDAEDTAFAILDGGTR